MTTKPVTITLPAALIDKIDDAATRDRRNRSNWVAVKLAEILDSEISGEYEPRGIGGGRKPASGHVSDDNATPVYSDENLTKPPPSTTPKPKPRPSKKSTIDGAVRAKKGFKPKVKANAKAKDRSTKGFNTN